VGDHSFHWSALTALDYHYWSQPLPTGVGWWADKSPEWFKHFQSHFVWALEIIRAVLSGRAASRLYRGWIDNLLQVRDRHHRQLLLSIS